VMLVSKDTLVGEKTRALNLLTKIAVNRRERDAVTTTTK
jgi:hypothetical protein